MRELTGNEMHRVSGAQGERAWDELPDACSVETMETNAIGGAMAGAFGGAVGGPVGALAGAIGGAAIGAASAAIGCAIEVSSHGDGG